MIPKICKLQIQLEHFSVGLSWVVYFRDTPLSWRPLRLWSWLWGWDENHTLHAPAYRPPARAAVVRCVARNSPAFNYLLHQGTWQPYCSLLWDFNTRFFLSCPPLYSQEHNRHKLSPVIKMSLLLYCNVCIFWMLWQSSHIAHSVIARQWFIILCTSALLWLEGME